MVSVRDTAGVHGGFPVYKDLFTAHPVAEAGPDKAADSAALQFRVAPWQVVHAGCFCGGEPRAALEIRKSCLHQTARRLFSLFHVRHAGADRLVMDRNNRAKEPE